MSPGTTHDSLIERLALRRLDRPGRLNGRSLRRLHARLLRRSLMNRLLARLLQRSWSSTSSQGEALIWPRAAQSSDVAAVAMLPSAPGIFLTVNAAVSMTASRERDAAQSASVASAPLMLASNGPARTTSVSTAGVSSAPMLQSPAPSDGENLSTAHELRAVERFSTLTRVDEFVAPRTDKARDATHDRELVSRLHARRSEISATSNLAAASATGQAAYSEFPPRSGIAPSASPVAFELEPAALPVRPGQPLAMELSVSAARPPVALAVAQAAESLRSVPPVTTAALARRASLATVLELAPAFVSPPGELPLRKTLVASPQPEQAAQLASRATGAPAPRAAEKSLAPSSRANDPRMHSPSSARREPAIDLDRLVTEVSGRLASELRIERERRGIRSW